MWHRENPKQQQQQQQQQRETVNPQSMWHRENPKQQQSSMVSGDAAMLSSSSRSCSTVRKGLQLATEFSRGEEGGEVQAGPRW
jgi:hypothetical protein